MLSRGYFPLALGAADIVENQFDPVFYGNYTMASGLGAWATSTLYALNDPRMAGFSSAVKRGRVRRWPAGPSSPRSTPPSLTARLGGCS
jgi:hypothetical protein